jgi:hypothetical protein
MSLGLKAISQFGIAQLMGRALGPVITVSGPPLFGVVGAIGGLVGAFAEPEAITAMRAARAALVGSYEPPAALSGTRRRLPQLAAKRGPI